MQIILKYFPDLNKVQQQQFAALDHLYKEWNSRINVISRKDMEGLYEKHVLHSLSIAAFFDFADDSEVIDLGTGGGFPGIPLAIFFPGVHFHLVDSISKKLKVVDAISKEIGLPNITTQHIRAEGITGRKFDFAVSRAVAPLKQLWKWTRPLLRNPKAQNENKKISPGLICLKGGNLQKEIKESGTQPRIFKISEIFGEEYFREKFILYITKEPQKKDQKIMPIQNTGK